MLYVVLLFVILYFLSELDPKKTNGKNYEKKLGDQSKVFHHDGDYSKKTLLKENLLENRGVNCEICGAHVELHVQHKLKISKSRTINSDNLQLLCYECHVKEQHYKFEKSKRKTQKLPLKFPYFRDAIRSKKTIKITYKKLNGEVSYRTILPIGIYKQGGHFYLKAHCYLRNEERTFRISRIIKFDG